MWKHIVLLALWILLELRGTDLGSVALAAARGEIPAKTLQVLKLERFLQSDWARENKHILDSLRSSPLYTRGRGPLEDKNLV